MLYSIGHAGTTLDNVQRLMSELDIAVLVDVRIQPSSRWQAEFWMPALKKRLGGAYVWRKDLV